MYHCRVVAVKRARGKEGGGDNDRRISKIVA